MVRAVEGCSSAGVVRAKLGAIKEAGEQEGPCSPFFPTLTTREACLIHLLVVERATWKERLTAVPGVEGVPAGKCFLGVAILPFLDGVRRRRSGQNITARSALHRPIEDALYFRRDSYRTPRGHGPIAAHGLITARVLYFATFLSIVFPSYTAVSPYLGRHTRNKGDRAK